MLLQHQPRCSISLCHEAECPQFVEILSKHLSTSSRNASACALLPAAQSTFLNVLAGQVQSGGHWKVQGAVYLDDRRLPNNKLAALTAHVPQVRRAWCDDRLIPSFHVSLCDSHVMGCSSGRMAVAARVAGWAV